MSIDDFFRYCQSVFDMFPVLTVSITAMSIISVGLALFWGFMRGRGD